MVYLSALYKGIGVMVTAGSAVEQSSVRRAPISLSAWRCLRYEVALNGLRILWETVNDFSLWRLIEYPWATRVLGVRRGDTVIDIGSGTSSFPHMLAKRA